MICGSGGSKGRLLKEAGAKPSDETKIARRCGPKDVSKSIYTKHNMIEALLEVPHHCGAKRNSKPK